MKVLVVEDNDELRQLVASHLQSRGFAVDPVASCEEASAALAASSHDVMLLDLTLPDGDGVDLLSEARERTGGRLPVVVLTARDGLDDRLKLLNAGADDFIVKPFEFLELEARLRAVLRRPGMRTALQLTCGDITIDLRSKDVTLGSQHLPLQRREFALLEELMRSFDRIVVRDVLEERLYSFNEPVTPNAIEQSVSRLRKRLGEAGSSLTIQTKRGIGYRLTTRDDAVGSRLNG